MSTQTIYALSSGSYSDYSVDLVFTPGTTKEEAEAAAERLNVGNRNWDEYCVEEFAIWPAHEVGATQVLRLEAIVGLREGDVLSEGQEVVATLDPGLHRPIDHAYWAPDKTWRTPDVVMHSDVRGNIIYARGEGWWEATQGRLVVSGIDHERVRKVYSERLAMIRSDETVRLHVKGTDWSELLPTLDNAEHEA